MSSWTWDFREEKHSDTSRLDKVVDNKTSICRTVRSGILSIDRLCPCIQACRCRFFEELNQSTIDIQEDSRVETVFSGRSCQRSEQSTSPGG